MYISMPFVLHTVLSAGTHPTPHPTQGGVPVAAVSNCQLLVSSPLHTFVGGSAPGSLVHTLDGVCAYTLLAATCPAHSTTCAMSYCSGRGIYPHTYMCGWQDMHMMESGQ